ncbi:hypothetical protein GRAN_0076 [Granulicella sibirica]|uniref:Uncharacterized protein n=1 Tax=Granulicella sibirica TaxID=2479048 RepID=A0A4Q0T578_9BACT|nr:hypothetical protein GRAN_0076 [Granulicella sibirica]
MCGFHCVFSHDALCHDFFDCTRMGCFPIVGAEAMNLTGAASKPEWQSA